MDDGPAVHGYAANIGSCHCYDLQLFSQFIEVGF
jgi:hypothetical protein